MSRSLLSQLLEAVVGLRSGVRRSPFEMLTSLAATKNWQKYVRGLQAKDLQMSSQPL
jgi:hypothetical protein